MKIIIIGRGNSALRCTPEFINQHNLIAVVNKFIFKGYEQYVSNKADIQFRNGTGDVFTEEEIRILGLKKIVYTHDNNKYPNYPSYYKGIEIIDPKPTIRSEIRKIQHNFDPSSGMAGIYYVLNNYDVSELSLIGFDFYEVGQTPYYFKPEDADPQLKYLWKNNYKNNVINVKSGHDTDKTIEFVKFLISEHVNVQFNLMTDSTKFSDFQEKNIKYL